MRGTANTPDMGPCANCGESFGDHFIIALLRDFGAHVSGCKEYVVPKFSPPKDHPEDQP